jgi:peptidoglycan L-alanyl-D-glutamate endopeptidase CwlK
VVRGITNNMYKVLVLRNKITVNIEDDCLKAVEYFKRRNINVSFDFKDTAIPVSIHKYNPAANGASYYGIDDSVKDACDKFVTKGEYHAVIFAWDTESIPTPNDGVPTSWSNWAPLTWAKADTEFIQLVTNDINDKVDWIYKTITHELIHSFCKRLNRRGLSVLDEMDITDGVPYFHNDDPEFPNGNYAQTLDNIKVYADKLYDFYFIDQEKMSIRYKRGDTGATVNKIQKDLKTLGFFKMLTTTNYFGPVTESAVKAFQKSVGLPVDGIVGYKTLQAIDLALKKNVKIDLGLRPLVQRQADYLLAVCEALGEPLRITEGLRSIERQNALYDQGRTIPGNIVTNARGGESFHNYGVAFDVVFTKTGYVGNWELVGKVGKALGFEWGGDFPNLKDNPHFEMKLGKTIQDFKENKVDYKSYL